MHGVLRVDKGKKRQPNHANLGREEAVKRTGSDGSERSAVMIQMRSEPSSAPVSIRSPSRPKQMSLILAECACAREHACVCLQAHTWHARSLGGER